MAQKTLLCFLLMLLIPTMLHAQDDDLHFNTGKGKIQLKKDQFYYVSGDTISFFADAFVLPEGAMLDRLLRKLPGVEYRSNSNIIIDGTTVKEMRVEGKEYFKNVMTSVVKRIPAYCIDQVKFYDYDQGKRMNIIIKKKYKGKWFAEFSAGLGPDGRYSEKAFAMVHGKKLRMTLFANANDINDTRQPGQETEWSPASMAKKRIELTNWRLGIYVEEKEPRHDRLCHREPQRNRCHYQSRQNQLDALRQHLSAD